MSVVEAFVDRFGFEVPDTYRLLATDGRLDHEAPTYFWFFDAEWLDEGQIRDFAWAAYEGTSFVPFAFTGGGDRWCWWPDARSGQDAPVVLCPHDCQDGTFYAPEFDSFLFRHALDLANGGFDQDDEAEARGALVGLAEIFDRQSVRSAWVGCLRWLARLPLQCEAEDSFILSKEQHKEILGRELAWPDLDREFRWMRGE